MLQAFAEDMRFFSQVLFNIMCSCQTEFSQACQLLRAMEKDAVIAGAAAAAAAQAVGADEETARRMGDKEAAAQRFAVHKFSGMVSQESTSM